MYFIYCLDNRIFHFCNRCAIVDCDNNKNITFNPAWLENSVPFENGLPENCHRFERISDIKETRQCDMESFNRSAVLNCDNGPMVFRTDELSIVNEVHKSISFNE